MAKRESRFDILRLLSMYMIICGHLIYHGIRNITSDEIIDVGFEHSLTGQINFCILQFMGYLCNIGPNLFVMITGYFLIQPHTIQYTLKKGFKLWISIVFYSVILYGLIVIANVKPFELEVLFAQLLPIHSSRYWFMTMYIGILLLSPFLAKLAQALTKKEYLYLLFILFLMNFAQENFGYGIVYSNIIFFYIFIFLIGGYINIYPKSKLFQYTGAIYIFLCMILAGVNIVNQLYFHATEFPQIRGLLNNSFPIITSICLFLWFYSQPNKDTRLSRFAISVSPYILGVYLIHDNSYIRHILWNEIVQPIKFIHNWYFIPFCLAVCIIIFFICLMMDKIRQKLIP